MAETKIETGIAQDDQAHLNAAFWERGDYLEFYANRSLRPVEEVLLERFRDALGGSVLELGCGAGRLTGHLSEVAREVHGVDLSPAMVAYCRQAYPGVTFEVGDLRDLSAFESGSYDVVVAPFNVLDVFDDPERGGVLDQIRRVLVEGGLLIMSSHNRDYAPRIAPAIRLLVGNPRRPLQSIRRLPKRLRNRRRLAPLQRAENGYAIVNDEAHDFSVLHYYISRDAQASQLGEQGFELLECLDLDGRAVSTGAVAARCPELHYVARSMVGFTSRSAVAERA
jgi:SAM-dependent methyltransferase